MWLDLESAEVWSKNGLKFEEVWFGKNMLVFLITSSFIYMSHTYLIHITRVFSQVCTQKLHLEIRVCVFKAIRPVIKF